MPEISTLLQSLIAYLDQQTLESKHRMATHTEVSALIQQGSSDIQEIAAPTKKTRTKTKLDQEESAEYARDKKAVATPVTAYDTDTANAAALDAALAAATLKAEPVLSDKDAKALAQYEADAAHAKALDVAKAKAKADAERLAAMDAEKPDAELDYEKDYEKDVAPAIRNHAIDVNKRGAVMDALFTYGVKNGKALAPKDYASFLKHLEEQVAAAALGLDWYDYMDSLEAKA